MADVAFPEYVGANELRPRISTLAVTFSADVYVAIAERASVFVNCAHSYEKAEIYHHQQRHIYIFELSKKET